MSSTYSSRHSTNSSTTGHSNSHSRREISTPEVSATASAPASAGISHSSSSSSSRLVSASGSAKATNAITPITTTSNGTVACDSSSSSSTVASAAAGHLEYENSSGDFMKTKIKRKATGSVVLSEGGHTSEPPAPPPPPPGPVSSTPLSGESLKTTGSTSRSSKRRMGRSSTTNTTVKNSSSTNAPNMLVANGNSVPHDPYEFSESKFEVPSKKSKLDKLDMSSGHGSIDAATSTMSVETMTEEECFGPCLPGTQVNLNAIVWLETTGILVVNIPWRGRTYVGTLLDCTQHHYAPTNLYSYQPPYETRGPHRGRGKRRNFAYGLNGRTTRGGGKNRAGVATASSKQQQAGSRNSLDAKGLEDACEEDDGSKGYFHDDSPANSVYNFGEGVKTEDSTAMTDALKLADGGGVDANGEPLLIECPWPECQHRFSKYTALRYHQGHFHSVNNSSSNSSTSRKSTQITLRLTSPTSPKTGSTSRKSPHKRKQQQQQLKEETRLSVTVKREASERSSPSSFLPPPAAAAATSHKDDAPNKDHQHSESPNFVSHPQVSGIPTLTVEEVNSSKVSSSSSSHPPIIVTSTSSSNSSRLPSRLPPGVKCSSPAVVSGGGSVVVSAAPSVFYSLPTTATSASVIPSPGRPLISSLVPGTHICHPLVEPRITESTSPPPLSRNPATVTATPLHMASQQPASLALLKSIQPRPPVITSSLSPGGASANSVGNVILPSKKRLRRSPPLPATGSNSNSNSSKTSSTILLPNNVTITKPLSTTTASVLPACIPAPPYLPLNVSLPGSGGSHDGGSLPHLNGFTSTTPGSLSVPIISPVLPSVPSHDAPPRSPAYSDISDPNDEPLPVLEKEEEVFRSPGACDRHSASFLFQQPPPSLVPAVVSTGDLPTSLNSSSALNPSSPYFTTNGSIILDSQNVKTTVAFGNHISVPGLEEDKQHHHRVTFYSTATAQQSNPSPHFRLSTSPLTVSTAVANNHSIFVPQSAKLASDLRHLATSTIASSSPALASPNSLVVPGGSAAGFHHHTVLHLNAPSSAAGSASVTQAANLPAGLPLNVTGTPGAYVLSSGAATTPNLTPHLTLYQQR